MAKYDYILENDYEEAFIISLQLNAVNFFKLKDLCYNNLFSSNFINLNLSVIYRLLNNIEEISILSDKRSKSFEIEEIIKICYDYKKSVLGNILKNIVSTENKRVLSVVNQDVFFENINNLVNKIKQS